MQVWFVRYQESKQCKTSQTVYSSVPPQEMIDKLGPYQELGIDRLILNVNFGVDANETLDCIQSFAEDVMPHFSPSCAAGIDSSLNAGSFAASQTI